MAPKCLFSMIDSWDEMMEREAMLQAYVNNGGELESRNKENLESYEVHPDCF